MRQPQIDKAGAASPYSLRWIARAARIWVSALILWKKRRAVSSADVNSAYVCRPPYRGKYRVVMRLQSKAQAIDAAAGIAFQFFFIERFGVALRR